jgi:phenylalanine ammonia-lyase
MRTTEVFALQEALMQLTQSGVLTSPKGYSGSLPNDAMQAAWVRATIAVRLNATLRGHSAVSFPVLEALKGLLEARLVPVVPLRGSVSASGDLTPLAYIAGAIQGNPRISVLDSVSGEIMPADVALHRIKQTPVLLGPKEGLGLVNGTAASAAVGALVMHHANHLAVLTQALSSMAVEVCEPYIICYLLNYGPRF